MAEESIEERVEYLQVALEGKADRQDMQAVSEALILIAGVLDDLVRANENVDASEYDADINRVRQLGRLIM